MKTENKVQPNSIALAGKMRVMAKTGRNIPLTAEEVAAIPKGILVPKCKYEGKTQVSHRPNRSQIASFRRRQRREMFSRPGYVAQVIWGFDVETKKVTKKRVFHFKSLSGGN